jgi:RHH-type proline utilization regulon transcriptional repressor/proline dehydrogenase/delta 1-pyrroline-5-carboxylate dehydrogenase
MVLLCRESGKTYANAIAEVREAVDFLRYYATQMIDLDANAEVEPLGTCYALAHGTSHWPSSQVRLLLHWLRVIP